MANKYNWFTHRNDAHEDLFIQESMDRFGHFGYSAYFIMLEVFDRHGSGDKLDVTLKVLAQKLRSRPTVVRQFLDFCRINNKITLTEDGQKIGIGIKNFRKFHSNRKSKITSTSPQKPSKVTLHNNNKDNNNNITKESFECFWNVYPKKVAKPQAIKAWQKLNPDAVLSEKVVNAVKTLADSDQWNKEGGQYIPNPATFINQERFNDVVEVKPKKKDAYDLLVERQALEKLNGK